MEIQEHKFKSTPEGFIEAKAWLIEVGEWDNLACFSTDGWSIVAEANALWYRKYYLLKG